LSHPYLREDVPISEPKALNLAFDLLPFTPQPFEKKCASLFEMRAHLLVVQKASANGFRTHDAMLSNATA
jgi:hypothetical protein